MARKPEWRIEEGSPGSFDLFHDRRLVSMDRESVEEAKNEAKRRGATQVTVVESDGYNTVVRL